MVDQMKIRVTLYKNSQNPSGGQDVLISPHWGKEDMLQTCFQALGIRAKKIYSENGALLNSFESLRDGAVLYVSQGENFQVRTSSGAPHKTSKKYVLVMLGTAAVGKSAITLRYHSNKFVKDYDPTIEDYYNKSTVIDGEPTQLSILDTAGMEDYYPLIDDWIDRKNAFILVFSVEIPDSLKRLRYFHEKILHRYSGEAKEPLVVIAANKTDLPNRNVTAEEGKRFADELGVRYFEVSAANNTNIEEMFTFIIRELKHREVKKPDRKKPWYEKCELL